MQVGCPNKNSIEFKNAVKAKGEEGAYADWLYSKTDKQDALLNDLNNRKIRLIQSLKTLVNKKDKASSIEKGKLKNELQRLEEKIEDAERGLSTGEILELARTEYNFAGDILKQKNLSPQQLNEVKDIIDFWTNPDIITDTPYRIVDLLDIGANSPSIQELADLQRRFRDYLGKWNEIVLTRANTAYSNVSPNADMISSLEKDSNIGQTYFRDLNTFNKPLVQLMKDQMNKSETRSVIRFNEEDKELENLFKNAKNWKDKLIENDDLIHQFSNKYWNDLEAMFKSTAKNPSKRKEWKKKHLIPFDVRKLYYDVYRENGGEEVFTTAQIQEHKNELINTIGEHEFNKRISWLDAKIEEFRIQVENIKDKNESLYEGAELDEMNNREILPLSMFYYIDTTYGNKPFQKILNKTIYPTSGVRPYEIPRKTVDNKDTNWYNPKYDEVLKDKDLLNLYEGLIELNHRILHLFPEIRNNGYKLNSIPAIKQSLVNQLGDILKNDTANVKGAYNLFHDKFIEAITTEDNPREYPKDSQGNSIRTFNYNIHKANKPVNIEAAFRNILSMAVQYEERIVVEPIVRIYERIIKDKAGSDLSKTLQAIDYDLEYFYRKPRTDEGKTNITKLTSEEKKKKKEIETKLSKNEITEEEAVEQIAKLGSKVAVGNVAELAMQYVHVKAMSWNLFSAITNFGFSVISNLIESAGGEHFTDGEYLKAMGMLLSTTGRLSPVQRKLAKKLSAINDKLQIVDSVDDLTFTRKQKLLKQNFGIFMPYGITQKTEYINQMSTAIAMLLHTKIDNKSLFDHFDENGNLNISDDWNGDWNNSDHNTKLIALRNKIASVKTSIHGNYDPSNRVLIKKTILGRATMMFRSWMAETFANRFQNERPDLRTGTIVKGRWRTYGDIAKNKGFSQIFKELYNVALKKPSDLNERDLINMRKNLRELAILISMASLYYLLKGVEDDDDKYAKYFRNYMLNVAGRLTTEITFFISPVSFEEITRASLPPAQLIIDSEKWLQATYKLAIGEDEYKGGIYDGQSRWLRSSGKLVPGFSSVIRQYNVATTEN